MLYFLCNSLGGDFGVLGCRLLSEEKDMLPNDQGMIEEQRPVESDRAWLRSRDQWKAIKTLGIWGGVDFEFRNGPTYFLTCLILIGNHWILAQLFVERHTQFSILQYRLLLFTVYDRHLGRCVRNTNNLCFHFMGQIFRNICLARSLFYIISDIGRFVSFRIAGAQCVEGER